MLELASVRCLRALAFLVDLFNASCCMTVSIQSGVLTSGRCRWRETARSRFRSSRRTSTKVSPSFLPTEHGSPTSRTGRVALKSTSDRFAVLESTACGFPSMAVHKCVGTPTARNCSISRRITSSWRFRRFVSSGTAAELGTPLGLFATSVGSIVGLKYRQQYVVSPDGQSFVMHSVVGKTDISPIAVILNWKPKR